MLWIALMDLFLLWWNQFITTIAEEPIGSSKANAHISGTARLVNKIEIFIFSLSSPLHCIAPLSRKCQTLNWFFGRFFSFFISWAQCTFYRSKHVVSAPTLDDQQSPVVTMTTWSNPPLSLCSFSSSPSYPSEIIMIKMTIVIMIMITIFIVTRRPILREGESVREVGGLTQCSTCSHSITNQPLDNVVMIFIIGIMP